MVLDTTTPMRPGVPPKLLGEFDELCRPSTNPRLSEHCRRLARTTQDSVDAAEPLRDVLTKMMEWMAEHGCFDEAAGGSEQKTAMVVTLGESNLKRHLPRECLELEVKLPPLIRDWIQLRTLFNCHTGLQKLSKEERSGAGAGERTAAEAEAHQVREILHLK